MSYSMGYSYGVGDGVYPYWGVGSGFYLAPEDAEAIRKEVAEAIRNSWNRFRAWATQISFSPSKVKYTLLFQKSTSDPKINKVTDWEKAAAEFLTVTVPLWKGKILSRLSATISKMRSPDAKYKQFEMVATRSLSALEGVITDYENKRTKRLGRMAAVTRFFYCNTFEGGDNRKDQISALRQVQAVIDKQEDRSKKHLELCKQMQRGVLFLLLDDIEKESRGKENRFGPGSQLRLAAIAGLKRLDVDDIEKYAGKGEAIGVAKANFKKHPAMAKTPGRYSWMDKMLGRYSYYDMQEGTVTYYDSNNTIICFEQVHPPMLHPYGPLPGM